MKKTIPLLIITILSLSSIWAGEILDVQNLKIGSAYVVSRRTPLMPEVNPSDPLSAAEKMKNIPAGGAFKISGIEMKNGNPWYKVAAIGVDNKPIGQGYINSGALLGQDLKSFKN